MRSLRRNRDQGEFFIRPGFGHGEQKHDGGERALGAPVRIKADDLRLAVNAPDVNDLSQTAVAHNAQRLAHRLMIPMIETIHQLLPGMLLFTSSHGNDIRHIFARRLLAKDM